MRGQDFSAVLRGARIDFGVQRVSAAEPPVIAIDGPSASGKGTVARKVADALNFHFLDSGALYRLVAVAALDAGVDLSNGPEIAAIARNLDVRFDADTIHLNSRDVTNAIRAE